MKDTRFAVSFRLESLTTSNGQVTTIDGELGTPKTEPFLPLRIMSSHAFRRRLARSIG